MATRSKQSLLAKYEKQQQKLHPVNFGAFPTGSNLRNFLLLIAIGVALIALPIILPDLTKEFYRQRAVTVIKNFELKNDFFRGQYKSSSRSGDTKPNLDATFMAVSILAKADEKFDYPDATANYVRSVTHSSDSVKLIYQQISLFKSLSSSSDLSQYYNLLLDAFTERHGGFRMTRDSASSIEATFYAFESIQLLGKMDEFRKTEQFSSAIRFVVYQKDSQTNGFVDSKFRGSPSILASYHAVKILQYASSSSELTNLVTEAAKNLDLFVYSCQAPDGGFLNIPVASYQQQQKEEQSKDEDADADKADHKSEDENAIYAVVSVSSDTSRGFYILHSIPELQRSGSGKNNLYSIFATLFDLNAARYYRASSYLRSCISLFSGVVRSFPSCRTDLEGSYYFLELAGQYPNVVVGIPRGFQLFLTGLGCMLLLLSVFFYIKEQTPDNSTKFAESIFRVSLFFVVIGALSLCFYPRLAILVYLIYAIYLARQFYSVISIDNTDGIVSLVVACHVVLFSGMVYLFVSIASIQFAFPSTLLVLLAWAGISSFVVSGAASYTAKLNRLKPFVEAGFLGWVVNIVLFYALFYGKGEIAVVYRLLLVQGHFAFVFVFFPLASFVLSYGGAALAAYLYLKTLSSDESKSPAVRKFKAQGVDASAPAAKTLALMKAKNNEKLREEEKARREQEKKKKGGDQKGKEEVKAIEAKKSDNSGDEGADDGEEDGDDTKEATDQ